MTEFHDENVNFDFSYEAEPQNVTDVTYLTDASDVSENHLGSLIELYETLPQLWNPTHPGYIKKDVRNRALDQLLPIYQKLKAGSTREDVWRKINTLRSNYRKEMKKISDSKRSGRGTDEVYQPTSWVYHALHFLCRYENPVGNIRHSEEPTEDQYNIEPGSSRSSVMSPPPPKRTHCPPEVQGDIQPGCSRSSVMSPPRPKRTQRPAQAKTSKQEKLLDKACHYLEQSNSRTVRTDNIPTIAIAWGETLNTLDPQQKIFAERAINEILFEAHLGKLDRYSVKINEEAWATSTPVKSQCSFGSNIITPPLYSPLDQQQQSRQSSVSYPSIITPPLYSPSYEQQQVEEDENQQNQMKVDDYAPISVFFKTFQPNQK